MQANTLAPYLTAIRHSLDSALCLRNFPSQVVERHNKPEVELRYVVVAVVCFLCAVSCGRTECLTVSLSLIHIGGTAISLSKELLLNPILICRNENEKCLIEPSVNSTRVSICIKKADEIETILAHKFNRFLMQRAEQFIIMRRVPVEVQSSDLCHSLLLTTGRWSS